MDENGLSNDNQLDLNKPIESLGILRIIKDGDLKDKWEVTMLGPKNSIYEKGVFKLDISFPKNYPKEKPEIKLNNIIYHLQYKPKIGRIDLMVLNSWDQCTPMTTVELLVSIYLFFSYENQNPDYAYIEEMRKEYIENREEFNRKAREWTLKYASPSNEDLLLIKELEGEKVDLIIDIKEKDINKDIVFINSKEDYYNDEIKELNDKNICLYIDGKKQKFQRNFKFSKGEHYISLKFKDKLKTCLRMFKDCCNIITIDLSLLDTSDVKSMEEMFSGCINLTKIRLSPIFQTENVLNMSKMFRNCKKLKDLDLSSFNTENVTNMSEMFSGCVNINDLNLSSFNTENVIKMTGLFYNCENLASFNISNWETGNVVDISNLFYGCISLAGLSDIANWDTTNISDMSNIFHECSSLISLPDEISKWNTINVINLNGVFSECSSLEKIPDISKWDTKKVTNMSYLFYNCSSIKNLPNISIWNTKSVKNMSFMFSKCISLESLPDMSNWITNEVIDMSYMFYRCLSLQSIPEISKWDTGNVSKVSYLFYGCKLIKTLPDISKWNTKNFTDISYMFYGCQSLVSLPDISKWDTNNITNLKMFISNCSSLSNIPDLTKWTLNNLKIDKNNLFKDIANFDKNKIQLNNTIKDDNLKFIPQIEMKFNNVKNIEKDILPKLKKELKNIIKKNDFSVIEIRKGSLTAVLALQYIIQDELLKQKDLNLSNLSDDFSQNISQEIENISTKIRESSFVCLGTIKPDSTDKNIVNITDEKIRKELNEKILNIEDNNEINIYEASKNINMEDLKNFYQNIALQAEELESNQSTIISKLDEFNKVFDQDIEKALKYSIFEYKIINIFVVEKENKEYKIAKEKCPDKIIKVLFHGTKIDCVTGILSTQFRDANRHIFGKGVYFTDVLDYAGFYAKKDVKKYNDIPKIDETFSVVASEIYYDKNKIEIVYNVQTKDKEVIKYGIRCAFADAGTRLLTKKELKGHKGFIGNEYLISDKNQILPLYAVTLKRVKYLVIWRDFNFNKNNLNNYKDAVFKKIQQFHTIIKRTISNDLNSKVYYIGETKEALDLIDRKKYNKIIIITNGANQAKEFILEARKIIGENIIAAVSAYDVQKHIKWVKDMNNVILLNDEEFHIRFFKSAINEDINSIKQLRIDIINHYKDSITNFNMKEISDDCLNFHNFKSEGNFKDLVFKNNSDSSCNIF